jgi:hypothetical protein
VHVKTNLNMTLLLTHCFSELASILSAYLRWTTRYHPPSTACFLNSIN